MQADQSTRALSEGAVVLQSAPAVHRRAAGELPLHLRCRAKREERAKEGSESAGGAVSSLDELGAALMHPSASAAARLGL